MDTEEPSGDDRDDGGTVTKDGVRQVGRGLHGCMDGRAFLGNGGDGVRRYKALRRLKRGLHPVNVIIFVMVETVMAKSH